MHAHETCPRFRRFCGLGSIPCASVTSQAHQTTRLAERVTPPPEWIRISRTGQTHASRQHGSGFSQGCKKTRVRVHQRSCLRTNPHARGYLRCPVKQNLRKRARIQVVSRILPPFPFPCHPLVGIMHQATTQYRSAQERSGLQLEGLQSYGSRTEAVRRSPTAPSERCDGCEGRSRTGNEPDKPHRGTRVGPARDDTACAWICTGRS